MTSQFSSYSERKTLQGRKLQFREMQIESKSYNTPDCINKITTDCTKKYLLLGMENGKIYIFDTKKNKIKRELEGENWISAIEACNGQVWFAGRSRSLNCMRYNDNGINFKLSIPIPKDKNQFNCKSS